MNTARLLPVTKKFTDESTLEYFKFTFYCDCCGRERQTPRYPFSAAGRVNNPESLTPAQKLIYNAEYDNAYEQANTDAIGYFTACCKCGGYVCEDCMLQAMPGTSVCLQCIENN